MQCVIAPVWLMQGIAISCLLPGVPLGMDFCNAMLQVAIRPWLCTL